MLLKYYSSVSDCVLDYVLFYDRPRRAGIRRLTGRGGRDFGRCSFYGDFRVSERHRISHPSHLLGIYPAGFMSRSGYLYQVAGLISQISIPIREKYKRQTNNTNN